MAAELELAALVAPLLSARGIDLEGVEFSRAGRRTLVTVVIDRDGGIDLDTVADVSREISAALDVHDSIVPPNSVLEVGSPGVDRPLTEERHWRRAADRLVVVTPHSGEPFTDRVVGVREGVVEFASGRAEPVTSLRSGRVQVEFTGVRDGH